MNRDDKSHHSDSAIPLLEDVVSMEEIESEYIEFANDEVDIEDSGLPEYDEELLSMRDDIPSNSRMIFKRSLLRR
ncbi:MAG: hypothetical protein B6D77_14815 [gamma proteobacterium symbiont of Ctena orbiculata]|nr:MAG: hypothetical protein B6D77_14815 [gamma proteobacterium symbiont of Ctena orbiculata]